MTTSDLSETLDKLIEFGAGTMSSEAIEELFGKFGGGDARKIFGGMKAGGVSPMAPIIPMNKMVPTGQPPVNVAMAKLATYGGNPAIAAPKQMPGLAATGPIGTQKVAATVPAAASTISPNAAQQIARQAGQNVAAQSAGPMAAMGGQSGGVADWWKKRSMGQKLAVGGGTVLGGGLAGGYALAPRRSDQQYSEWLDNIIQFDRGSYYSKKFIDPDTVASPRFKEFLKNIVSNPAGRSKTRQQYRNLLAWGAKKNPKLIGGKKFSNTSSAIQFADPRPRNPLGEFTQQEGGPDPNAMATTYKMPQPVQQGLSVSKAAGVAIAGGALGAIGGNIGKEGWAGMAKLVKHLSKKAKR